MKSKITKAASLEAWLTADTWQPQISETNVQAEVKQFCLKFKAYQSCNSVSDGDIVTVRLESRKDFFNRTVTINIGKGLFDRELEAWLPGMAKSQVLEAVHSRAGSIRVTVLDIHCLAIPELTDALVRQGGQEGILTVRDFLKKVRRELAMEQIRDHAFVCLDTLIGESEIDIVPEEAESLVEQELDRCREIAKSMGRTFDEMTSEELLDAVGQPDLDHFRVMVRNMMCMNISQALLRLHWQGKDPAALPVVEDAILDESCGASDYVVQRLLEKLHLM